MLRIASMLLAAAGTVAISSPAWAQGQPDYSRRPAFRTIDLSAGFPDDPRTVNVTAGGRLSAERVGPDCRGSIANAPDVRVNYSAGSMPLTFYATSDEDTTLVINGPDGRWYCNDDSDGLNPRVTFRTPASGQYDIYVGHFGGGRRIPARLFISEILSGNDGSGGERPDLSARPVYQTFARRERDRAREIQLTAGGPLEASVLGENCVGTIGRAPDVRVNYTPGRADAPLVFRVSSREDTTLAINGPDGRWYCNDDTNNLDPEIRFDRPAAGQYDVFVGHIERGATAPARLSVSDGRRR